jgi:hypothetical protein
MNTQDELDFKDKVIAQLRKDNSIRLQRIEKLLQTKTDMSANIANLEAQNAKLYAIIGKLHVELQKVKSILKTHK